MGSYKKLRLGRNQVSILRDSLISTSTNGYLRKQDRKLANSILKQLDKQV